MKRLTAQHITAERNLRARAGSIAAQRWTALDGYDDEGLARFMREALPALEATRAASITLTDAYLARMLHRAPLGLDAAEISSRIRNGAAIEEVYRRPFVTVWTGLKRGQLWEDAVGAGLNRLITLAQSDVQLSMREAVREVGLQDENIHGWERVPNDGACELCIAAAAQRYSTEDLMPLHDGCGCGVEPILDAGGAPRGESVYREIETPTDQPNVAVREHGELGPVLTNADQHFKDVEEIRF